MSLPPLFVSPEPEPEAEAKPPNLTDAVDNKKHKKPKKILSTHTSITGFEKAFEQFATASVQNSKDDMGIDSEVGETLALKESEGPQEKALELSPTQVCL